MPLQLPPSSPGYLFSVSDVAQAKIPTDTLNRIIVNAVQNGAPVAPGSADGVAALLAAILKNAQPKNCDYQPFPFAYAIWNRQQVLAKNPDRAYLLIQNVGSGDLLCVFEETGIEVTDFSATPDTQQTLIVQQTRAIRIVAGGSYEPNIAPRSAVTLFTLNTATNGLVIEGV